MSETIKVHVSERELSTLNDDIKMIFHPGDPCPVDQCNRTFTSFSAFNKHWKKTHVETVNVFSCPKCTFKGTMKDQVVRHCKLTHDLDLHCFPMTTEANKNYIETGGALPYVKDSTFTKKQQEAHRRRRMVLKDIANTSVLYKTETDCRDEIVSVEHVNGKFVKRKSLNPRWFVY